MPDTTLADPTDPSEEGYRPSRRPIRRLPADVELIGRDEELETIWAGVKAEKVAKRASITVIGGGPGLGKSSLAVHIAHSPQIEQRFPDGQLYFDLQVTVRADQGEEKSSAAAVEEDPIEVSARQLLRDFLTAVGMSPDKLAESHADLVGQFAEATEKRRYFIIIDNVMDERQVRDFTRANWFCHIVVIARRRLGAHVIVPGRAGSYELPMMLGGISDDAALELFRRHAHENGDLSAKDLADLAALIEPCDGNPLAIRILGATRAAQRELSLDDFVAKFGRAQQWTARIQESNQLWASFKLCYDALAPAAKALFKYLAAVPGKTFDHQLAAAAPIKAPDGAEPETDLAQAEQLIDALWDAQLIQRDHADYYTMHALLREFAFKGIDGGGVRRKAATQTINGHYLQRARQACGAIHARQGSTARQAELQWLTDERQNLVAAILNACQSQDEPSLTFAWQLSEVLADYFELRGVWEAWEQTFRATLERLEALDTAEGQLGRAHLLRGLGRLDGALHRWDDAIVNYHDAIVLFRQSDRRDTRTTHGRPRPAEVEVAATLRALGDVYRYTRQWDPARNCLERSQDILRRSDRPAEYAIAKRSLGAIRRADGKFDEAAKLCREAIEILARVGDERWEAAARLSLSDIYLDQGLPEKAEGQLKQCLTVFTEFGDVHWYGLTLRSLGEAQRLKHEYENALKSLAESDDALSQIGDSLWRASVLHAKGMVHLEQQEYDEALGCFEKCVEPFRSNHDVLWVGRTYLSIGHTLTLMNGGRLTSEARKLLNTAWPLLVEQNAQEDLVQLEALLALEGDETA